MWNLGFGLEGWQYYLKIFPWAGELEGLMLLPPTLFYSQLYILLKAHMKHFFKTKQNLKQLRRKRLVMRVSVIQIVRFSCSVMSDSLRPHELQQSRLPCPSPALGACSNSYPLSQWCHPIISSSLVPFCFQSLPASGSFLMSCHQVARVLEL